MHPCQMQYHDCFSLRSKRFRGVSAQISMFWPRENWGESKKERGGRGRGEKETLAVKPLDFENPVPANGARDWLGSGPYY